MHPENILRNKSPIFDTEYLKNGFFVQALGKSYLVFNGNCPHGFLFFLTYSLIKM